MRTVFRNPSPNTVLRAHRPADIDRWVVIIENFTQYTLFWTTDPQAETPAEIVDRHEGAVGPFSSVRAVLSAQRPSWEVRMTLSDQLKVNTAPSETWVLVRTLGEMAGAPAPPSAETTAPPPGETVTTPIVTPIVGGGGGGIIQVVKAIGGTDAANQSGYVPSGARLAYVEAVGGGGGGNPAGGGYGGGGGGWFRLLIPVSSGDSYFAVGGMGGSPGSNGSLSQFVIYNSSFPGGYAWQALGGEGGSATLGGLGGGTLGVGATGSGFALFQQSGAGANGVLGAGGRPGNGFGRIGVGAGAVDQSLFLPNGHGGDPGYAGEPGHVLIIFMA